ncbi:MAG: histidine triad nucleotide-binding protein [Chloroflexi bacterium]|nr:histidine triad nucleotide-binding protein [Chloroflexota bacterium]
MTKDDCIFCKIGDREIPAEFLYRDDFVFAIRDIKPEAPVHILIIPFAHIVDLSSEPTERLHALGSLFSASTTLAKQLNVTESGYRLVVNQGPDSGQWVPHLHMHLLAGRPLSAIG